MGGLSQALAIYVLFCGYFCLKFIPLVLRMEKKKTELLDIWPASPELAHAVMACESRSELLGLVQDLFETIGSEAAHLGALGNWLLKNFSTQMLSAAHIYVQPEILPRVVEGRFHVLCPERSIYRLVHPQGGVGVYYGVAELNAFSGKLTLYDNCQVYAEHTEVIGRDHSRANLIQDCKASLYEHAHGIANRSNQVQVYDYAQGRTSEENTATNNLFSAYGHSSLTLDIPWQKVVAYGQPLIFDWGNNPIEFKQGGVLFQPDGNSKYADQSGVILFHKMEACGYLRAYEAQRDRRVVKPVTDLLPEVAREVYLQTENNRERIQVILDSFDYLAEQGLTGEALEAAFPKELLLSHQVYTNKTGVEGSPKGDYYVLGDLVLTQGDDRARGHFADCAIGHVLAGEGMSLGHSLGVASGTGSVHGSNLLIGRDQSQLACDGTAKALALGDSCVVAKGRSFVKATDRAQVRASEQTVTNLRGQAKGEFSGDARFVAEEDSSYICRERAKGNKAHEYVNPATFDPAKATKGLGTPTGTSEVPGAVTWIYTNNVKTALEGYIQEQEINCSAKTGKGVSR